MSDDQQMDEGTEKRVFTVLDQKNLIKVIYKMYGINLDKMGIVQMMLVLMTSFKHEWNQCLYGISVITKTKEKVVNGEIVKATAMNIKELGCPEEYAALFKGINYPPVHRGTMGNTNGLGTILYMHRITPIDKYKAKWHKLAKSAMVNVQYASGVIKHMNEAGQGDMKHPWAILDSSCSSAESRRRIRLPYRIRLPLAAFMSRVYKWHNPAKGCASNRWTSQTGEDGYG